MDERKTVTLTRYPKASGPLGTFGEIDTGRFKYPTLERPSTGEHPCVPLGEYDVDWTDDGRHPKHNPCYEVMDVPGRTAILIHAANWYQQLLGCIAPGTKNEVVEGVYEGQEMKQLGVSGSGPALKALLDDLGRQNFKLLIKEA